MVAGEDDLLRCLLGGDGSLLGTPDVDEAVEDVHPGVLGPHALPQIGGAVTVWVRWVPRPATMAQVEWNESGRLSGELCGHGHSFRIHGEVNKCSSSQGHVLGIAISPVL